MASGFEDFSDVTRSNGVDNDCLTNFGTDKGEIGDDIEPKRRASRGLSVSRYLLESVGVVLEGSFSTVQFSYSSIIFV